MKIKYLVEPKPHCLIWCNCHGFLGDVCKQSTNTLLLYLNRCFRYLDFWCFPPYRWTQISELSPPHIFQTDSLHVEEKNVSIFFTSDLFSCWGSRMFERHAYTPDTESFTSVATLIPSRWPISKMTLIFFFADLNDCFLHFKFKYIWCCTHWWVRRNRPIRASLAALRMREWEKKSLNS